MISRGTAIHAVLMCTFVIRALMPIGYMPGNLLEGEFAQLCPSGMPQRASKIGHKAHHAEGKTIEHANSSEECQFGVALNQWMVLDSTAILFDTIARACSVIRHVYANSFPSPSLAFRSRAPPVDLV